jgi:hypothetical protein
MMKEKLSDKTKNVDIKFSVLDAFRNTLHQVCSKSKGWKAKYLTFWEQ